jgi:ketosteroid isomerase-like protein
MSKRNVKLTRHFMGAFNARDLYAMLAHCDPRIEWHSAFAAVGGAVYHGREGIQRWHGDFEEVWGDEIRGEPEAYFDLGHDTLIFYVLHGRGKHSGATVAMPVATVFRWRADLIVYLKGYVHREDALRDLGISEDELEPIGP